jgi:hypothetical protein
MSIYQKHTAQRANSVFSQFLKITGLTKFLGGLLILAASITSIQAGGNITLAWNPSSDPVVAGYDIYYGGTSGVYTNETSVGLATSLTISNLVYGSTYYFAATTYNAAGVESSFSTEVSYAVPMPPPGVQPLVTQQLSGSSMSNSIFSFVLTGPVGSNSVIQASTDLVHWTPFSTNTIPPGGSVKIADHNPNSAREFYRAVPAGTMVSTAKPKL